MRTGGCNLQTPLDMFLAPDVLQIGRFANVSILHWWKTSRERLDQLFLVEVPNQRHQVRCSDDFQSFDQCCFSCVCCRNEYPRETTLLRQTDHRQNSMRVPQAAIER